MYSDDDTHRWVGCPIRISTDQSLLAAPHGFSQRATSFVASWCQGIHRMPLLCSITPHAQKPPTPEPKAVKPKPPHRQIPRRREISHNARLHFVVPERLPTILKTPRMPKHPRRVRPTRIAARPETHQPLHTDNEHANTRPAPTTPTQPRLAWTVKIRSEIPS